MSDGALVKMEVDFSASADELIPIARSLAEAGRVEEAIEKCVVLEAQTRIACDAITTSRLLETIIVILAEAKRWKKLNEYLLSMTKKRGQLKQAVTKMTQKAIEYLEQTPDKSSKLELLGALRTVTEGKIYVEVERARLTRELARIKEEDGDIEEAASVLQELQIETFGSMEKKEKVEFILEQMRLCLARKDYTRVQIISKKVSTKFFQEPGTEELKLKFYNLMIQVDSLEHSYLSISKHYWEVFNTKSVEADEKQKLNALKNVIAYLLLAPFDNEQNDLMHRRKSFRMLESIPQYSSMLGKFLSKELMRWDEFLIKFKDVLTSDIVLFSDKDGPDKAQKHWDDLHSRVIEHNIRVIAEYYTQIRLKRLAELLDLSVESLTGFRI
ncbi:unnamed protein product [Protopolystoma xenopodis]|uniref:PCI domain-containing protein n=1 Tax=Protopolystoma xenopodis TaxID=117903 RepID=A0A3S5CN56_9PLAT|nr:unnamed protein product [Protopolystoma xenopodis]